MRMFDLEDMDGILRCIVWPEEFAKFGHLVTPDAILVVRGAPSIAGREAKRSNLIVNELATPADYQSRATRSVEIRLQEDDRAMANLESVYEILRGYPGQLRRAIGPDARLGHGRRSEERDATNCGGR